MENKELSEIKIEASKDKNQYEERIKNFADALDEKITFLKDKKSAVEESARESYDEKVQMLADKKQQVSDQLTAIKSATQEKWDATSDAVSREVQAISDETHEAYTGIKSGFGYLFDKLKGK